MIMNIFEQSVLCSYMTDLLNACLLKFNMYAYLFLLSLLIQPYYVENIGAHYSCVINHSVYISPVRQLMSQLKVFFLDFCTVCLTLVSRSHDDLGE
jgi:hypothetical protein